MLSCLNKGLGTNLTREQVPGEDSQPKNGKEGFETRPRISVFLYGVYLIKCLRVWPLDLSCSFLLSFPKGTKTLITRRKFVPKIWPANLCRCSPPKPAPSMPLVVDVAGNCNPMIRARWWAKLLLLTLRRFAGQLRPGQKANLNQKKNEMAEASRPPPLLSIP